MGFRSIHGEFLGYRLSFRPRDVDEEMAEVITIEDPMANVSFDTYIMEKNQILGASMDSLNSSFAYPTVKKIV